MIPPQRIVSLVPSTTESVCALGAAAQLVGCTRYCSEPAAELGPVARIGGTKNPRRDAVLALRPDLVLGNAEENRPEDLEWLAARVPVLTQTPRTVAEAAAALRELAVRLQRLEAAVPFLLRIEAQLAAAAAARLGRPPLRVVYVIWRKPWMAVNADTYIHDVLQIAGAQNATAGFPSRYPEFSPDELVQAGLDLVLLPDEPWVFDPVQLDELRRLATFGSATLRLCDGRDFCWHGVRMADGIGRAVAMLEAVADGKSPPMDRLG